LIPFQTSKLFDVNYNIPEGCKITDNCGGTSSGKTYSILQVLILKAYENPGVIITVCGQDIPNLKKGALRDIQRIIDSSEFVRSIIKSYNKTDRIYEFSNGSKIEFNSYDDEQDAKNGKRDYLFINEANGVSYEIFEQLYVRTSKHTWLDYNPSAHFWVNDKIRGREYVRTIKSTFKHNPFLPQDVVDKILSYKGTDEYRWKVYGLGEFAPLEGAIFKNWEDGEFDLSLPYVWGLDFGYTNDPTALSRVSIDKKKKVMYAGEHLYATHLSTSDIIQSLDSIIDFKDDLIICDNSEPRLIDELVSAGFNAVACVKGPDSVRKGIKDMQGFKIIADPDSHNLKTELTQYQWNDKRSGVPIDAWNHLIDSIRYGFSYLYHDAPVRFF